MSDCNHDFTEEELKLFEYVMDIRENREPYTLTPDEREKVIKLLDGCEGYNFNVMEIYKHRSGKIIVRTPDAYWMGLMGREWLIDLEEGTCTLFGLN